MDLNVYPILLDIGVASAGYECRNRNRDGGRGGVVGIASSNRPISFDKKHTDGVGLSPVSRSRTGVVARRKVRV